MGSWSSKHTKSDANGLKPHALKEGGWGFYEAAECFNDHTIYWICLDHRHAHPKQFILSMSISVLETGRLCVNLMGLTALSLID